MNEPFITLNTVSRIYDPETSGGIEVAALRDVSASIRNGERVGIVGDNGAGKSTLLQIIAGVNTATSGQVDVGGRVHAILTIGLGLREEATGRENLYLEGALLGKSRDEITAKLSEIIAFAELGDFIDKPVRTYSSGMKSRLSFASLAHIDPEILIIDEALSVGDAFFAAKATRMMQDLCGRGRIVLLVSHSIGAIKQMCQRCIWLEGGRVRADGPVEEVTTAYAAVTRARDEQEIARKFGDQMKPWAAGPDVTITSASLLRQPDAVETAMVEAGTRASLDVKFNLARALDAADVRVWIESNDGMVLADEIEPVPLSGRDAGAHRMSIALGALDWRPFLYRAHIELREMQRPLARMVVPFRVYSDITIFGGSPLLRFAPELRIDTPAPTPTPRNSAI